jgi:hypothetical protein
MSIGILSLGNSRVRLAASAIFMLGLLIFAFITSPPVSRARLNVSQDKTNGDRKRSRPAFVAGDVLVRYQTDSIAQRQQSKPAALKVEGRTIPIQVERFDGSDLVAGLRLAHVAPEDTMSAIAALKKQTGVLYAEPNYIIHTDLTPNDPCFLPNNVVACGSTPTISSDLYGLRKIGMQAAWNTRTDSSSIVVGVIDEGIDIVHPDLAANIWTNPHPGSFPPITGDLHGYDFINDSGTIPAGSHATHVAGTIGAVGNNNAGVVGVNWQVKLMSLRFISAAQGTDLDAIRACTYAKQMRDLWVSSGGTQGANVRVLNNSYGSNAFTQAFLDAINALNSSGILFVAAAGNFPEDPIINNDLGPHYPSNYVAPNLIAVAATDQNDLLPSFSHYGAQSVDLGAPGTGILSTFPANTYAVVSGTSMATPHVAGAAALLLAQNSGLSAQKVKGLLIFSGDLFPGLNGKTITGRRLNVANSLASLAENDTTAPGTVGDFHIDTQNGRALSLKWTASGDDGSIGLAALYRLSFTDSTSGAVTLLPNLIPATSGTSQTVNANFPYGHTNGTLTLREFDNAGNEGTPATINVSTTQVVGDPYATTVGKSLPLSTGGTPVTFPGDDDSYNQNYPLPFTFNFFGQNFNAVTISTNGNLYFSTPPFRSNGDADDVPSAILALGQYKMISGLWDDLYLGTDQRADAGVYVVQPTVQPGEPSRIIFRWQGVPCNANGDSFCHFGGAPVNFEIELRSNGFILTRFGSGNTSLFPVVGISGGEVDPYTIPDHTSEFTTTNLTNAQQVTYIPRAAMNPSDYVDFFVSQHYRDFLSREPDAGGDAFWIDQILNCGTNQACINTKRVDVSDAFFFEPEFQQTGSYVFRLYRAAFGNTQPFPNPDTTPGFPGEVNKLPLYPKFKADRELVIGGSNLAQLQQDLANAFVQRAEFIARYPASMTLDQFVAAILLQIKNDSGPNADLTGLQSSLVALGSRGAVMYRLANDDLQTGNGGINNRLFVDAEYNRAFVYSQYAGYFRRDADIAGFLFWLGQVNNGPLRDVTKQHAMNCSQLTSQEYQFRFSPIATHGNNECQ